MENYCRPEKEKFGWRPLPNELKKTRTIDENANLKGIPCLQQNDFQKILPSSVVNIMKQTNLETMNKEWREFMLAKYQEWKLPIQISSDLYEQQKTYRIGVNIFIKHFIQPTHQNPRMLEYDRRFINDLTDFCITTTAMREQFPIEPFTQLISKVSPDGLKCQITPSQLIDLTRACISDLVKQPGQISGPLKQLFESTIIRNLYPDIGHSIVFSCPDGLRFWLSTLSFHSENQQITFPKLTCSILKRLWTTPNSMHSIFESMCDLDTFENSDEEDHNMTYYDSCSSSSSCDDLEDD